MRYHNTEHAKIVKSLRDAGMQPKQVAEHMTKATGEKWTPNKVWRYSAKY